jgi:glycosidase
MNSRFAYQLSRFAYLTALALLLVVSLAACDTSGGTATVTPALSTPTVAPTLTAAPPTSTIAATSTSAGATPTTKAAFDVFPGATATAPADKAVAPLWVRDAVLYQIFVRNFTPEGTLAAAEKRLPDLKDMGVNLIYLMPIHPTGKVNRKGSLGSPYSIADYYAIDPALGTEADLKSFVDTAHGLGMKVIMDLVANHTAWDSVLAKEHPDWFKHDASGNFVPPMPDWTDVIQIDHSKPGVLQYFTDMTTHYMQADGIDGFRADYSTGVPLEFWLGLRTALKKVNPDVFLLSENDDAALTKAFDATYDQHLYRDVVPAVLGSNPHRLIIDPATNYANDGPYLLQTRFYENHDHDRVAAPFKNLPPEALQAASAYLLTTDGIPFIQNGQEVGITHTISLFEPDPIQWQLGNQQLRQTFKTVLAIRNANPALRHGDIVDVGTIVPGVAAFVRRTADQQVLVVLSFARNKAHATLDPSLARHKGKDLVTGSDVDLGAGLDMAPWSWRIIELK